MSARIPNTLRAGRTLLTHELREQGPLTALVLALGVALVLGLRAASGSGPGELGKALPYLAPGLGALLAAFLGAEAWSRDVHTGLARALSAAPLRVSVYGAVRVVVLALATAIVCGALLALEPPAQDRFAVWSTRTTAGVVAASVLLSALTALALRHGVAAALVGGTLGTWTLWSATSILVDPLRQSDGALIRYGLLVQLDVLRRPITIALGVVALVAATALRGPAQRSVWRRSARATFAAIVLLGPSVASGLHAVFSLMHVPFDAHDTQLCSVAPSPDGARVLVQVERRRSLPGHEGQLKRNSAWVIDTHTGARSQLPHGVYHGTWDDTTHVLFQPFGASVPEEALLLDVETGETRPRTGSDTVPVESSRSVDKLTGGARMKLTGGARLEIVREHRVRLSDGRISEPFLALTFRSDGRGAQRFYYVSEERVLRELSLVDGSHRALGGVHVEGVLPRLSVSPDERWLSLREIRERDGDNGPSTYHLLRLIDLDADCGRVVAEAEGFHMGWRRGPHPLLIGGRPGIPYDDCRYALLGASGIVELPFGYAARGLEDLDGDRWLVTSEGGRIAVHAADGALLITLRKGHPGEPR